MNQVEDGTAVLTRAGCSADHLHLGFESEAVFMRCSPHPSCAPPDSRTVLLQVDRYWLARGTL